MENLSLFLHPQKRIEYKSDKPIRIRFVKVRLLMFLLAIGPFAVPIATAWICSPHENGCIPWDGYYAGGGGLHGTLIA